jgi:hypothetical protein
MLQIVTINTDFNSLIDNLKGACGVLSLKIKFQLLIFRF